MRTSFSLECGTDEFRNRKYFSCQLTDSPRAITCSALSCNHTHATLCLMTQRVQYQYWNLVLLWDICKSLCSTVSSEQHLRNSLHLNEITFTYVYIRASTRPTEINTMLTQDYLTTVDIQLKWYRMSKQAFDSCL